MRPEVLLSLIWIQAIGTLEVFLKDYFEKSQMTIKGVKNYPACKDYMSGMIKFRINQDFLIEHSCILGMRSKLLLL